MKDVYQTITDHVLANVDEVGQWKPCWHGANLTRPMNPTSNSYYHGTNVVTCWVTAMARGYSQQLWATYQQWKKAGAQVRKGERGTPIIFYKRIESNDPDEDGRIFARSHHVFNVAQVEGYPAAAWDEFEELSEEERLEAIERWIAQVEQEATIHHSDEPRAYFRPSTDEVHMPNFGLFHDPEHYYSTLFHELTHWTGHKSRLDREFSRKKEDYAKEELVAELGAAFLCADFGIDHATRDDHTAYIASWLKALKNDKRLIVRAAALADKGVDLLHQLASPIEEERIAA